MCNYCMDTYVSAQEICRRFSFQNNYRLLTHIFHYDVCWFCNMLQNYIRWRNKIIFILIITAFIIIKYAPVDNCSKRLDADEIKQYRKKSIHFTIMDVTIGIIALALKCETLIRAVLVSTLYVSSSLIIGLISDFYRDKSGYMH